MRYALLSSLALSLCLVGNSYAAEQDAAHDAHADKKPHHEQERRQELLKQFDTNHDGKLDETERSAAKTAHDEKRAARLEQMKTEHPKLFAKIDSNNDGTISPEEMEVARKHHVERSFKQNQEDGDHADHEENAGNKEHVNQTGRNEKHLHQPKNK